MTKAAAPVSRTPERRRSSQVPWPASTRLSQTKAGGDATHQEAQLHLRLDRAAEHVLLTDLGEPPGVRKDLGCCVHGEQRDEKHDEDDGGAAARTEHPWSASRAFAERRRRARPPAPGPRPRLGGRSTDGGEHHRVRCDVDRRRSDGPPRRSGSGASLQTAELSEELVDSGRVDLPHVATAPRPLLTSQLAAPQQRTHGLRTRPESGGHLGDAEVVVLPPHPGKLLRLFSQLQRKQRRTFAGSVKWVLPVPPEWCRPGAVRAGG